MQLQDTTNLCKFITVELDVSDSLGWEKTLSIINSSNKNINVLVNNAALSNPETRWDLINTSEEIWELAMKVNSTGVFLGMKKIIPEMIKNNIGSVINVSSIFGKVGSEMGAVYHAAKGSITTLTKAAAIAVAGSTGNSGQRCTAIKRILAQESIADDLVRAILEQAKTIKYGDPMDKEIQLGCVINASAAELFEKRVEDAARLGARILYHPRRQGALLPPIVVDFVPPNCELVQEETFGPIIPIVRVPDDDAAVIEISNGTPYGLSSGVCTNNIKRAITFIEGLDVGTVNIWEQPGYRIEMSPFGGIKNSGNGVKEGVAEAMKFYTNIKTYSFPWYN